MAAQQERPNTFISDSRGRACTQELRVLIATSCFLGSINLIRAPYTLGKIPKRALNGSIFFFPPEGNWPSRWLICSTAGTLMITPSELAVMGRGRMNFNGIARAQQFGTRAEGAGNAADFHGLDASDWVTDSKDQLIRLSRLPHQIFGLSGLPLPGQPWFFRSANWGGGETPSWRVVKTGSLFLLHWRGH